jgi:hypothetical protein
MNSRRGNLMSDMATIRATAARLKAEGMPVAEYSIRQWVKTGIPALLVSHQTGDKIYG